MMMQDKECTLKEYRESTLIDHGLKLDGGRWYAAYQWIRDPYELPDNKQVAYAKLCAIEKRLLKNTDVAAMYIDQMQEMLETGKACKLSFEELKNYDGPLHYISHHEVLNPRSLSTPCRIVFDTSANFHGHRLNDYWATGAAFINNLPGVFIRFRENEVGISGDIKRMYHSIRISTLDQHTHRF